MSSLPRQASVLRLLTQRIADTPSEHLCHHVSSLVDLLGQLRIGSNRGLESSGKARAAADDTASAHKFNTQLSTLLQSKSPEARWIAVVLLKVYVEVGGVDVLQSSGQWVRTMVGFIGHKTEHATVKKASVLTLTKIYFMSYSFPNLVREITTPALQPFISNCLSSIGSGKGEEFRIRSRPELWTAILQCFIQLLPRHPASFRPHLSGIRLVLSRLVVGESPRGSAVRVPQQSSALARRLLALLPYCAPKNGAAEEWSKCFHATLQHATRTADHVLRAVEGNDTVASNQPHHASVRNYKDALSDHISDFLSLRPWQGISEGIDRLVGCLQILEDFLGNITQAAVPLPISEVCNLPQRLLSASGPFIGSDGEKNIVPTNPEVGRDERETLWAELPSLHRLSLNLLSTLLERLGIIGISLSEQVLEKIARVLEREGEHGTLRSTLYDTAAQVIAIIGPGFSKDNVNTIRPLLIAACLDGQRSVPGSTTEQSASTSDQITKASILGAKKATDAANLGALRDDTRNPLRLAALCLLGDFVGCVQSDLIPRALRVNIDRTIILAQDEIALISSVLNPDQRTVNNKLISSNLPFLARAYPASDTVEALVRPRLPVIRLSAQEDEDMEMETDDWRYRSGNSAPLGQGYQSPSAQDQQDGLPKPAPEKHTSPPELMEEPLESIQSPKRRWNGGTEPAAKGEPIGVAPHHKRARKEESTILPLSAPSPIATDDTQPKPAMQASAGKTDDGDEKNSAEEDFEIPPIQMPSDFEDSDEEDEE